MICFQIWLPSRWFRVTFVWKPQLATATGYSIPVQVALDYLNFNLHFMILKSLLPSMGVARRYWINRFILKSVLYGMYDVRILFQWKGHMILQDWRFLFYKCSFFLSYSLRDTRVSAVICVHKFKYFLYLLKINIIGINYGVKQDLFFKYYQYFCILKTQAEAIFFITFYGYLINLWLQCIFRMILTCWYEDGASSIT